MKILICPDKFKDSLSAQDACAAIAEGVSQKGMECQLKTAPLADGGEGTCELLTRYHQGSIIHLTVAGPVFTPVVAGYGISNDGRTAFIEMAKASGLALIQVERRNPLVTTTLGTGELIQHAISQGVSHIVMGIGGSATNDGGIGMASALGFEFLDRDGTALKPTGEHLVRIHSISDKRVITRLKEVEFTTLCDVNNPLHGPNGAACVYGPQKGADREAVERLDEGLANLEKVMMKYSDRSPDFPGAGAAGGLGAGAYVFLNSKIEKGFDFVMKTVGLRELIKNADIVITGEGKIDQQSLAGKVVMQVTQIASQIAKPVIAICGVNEVDESVLRTMGIRQVISLADEDTSAEQAISNAYNLIVKRTFHDMRL